MAGNLVGLARGDQNPAHGADTHDMMATLPVYVLAPAGPDRDAYLAALPGAEAVDSTVDPADLGGRPPGVVVVSASDLSAEALLQLGEALTGGGWTLAAIRNGDSARVRSLSVGRPEDLDAVTRFAESPDEAPECLLELHRTLVEIAKARHDINNPLTSALAETQILLMDVEDEEAREGLDAVQTQLRRIRDMVASTRHLRPPKD